MRLQGGQGCDMPAPLHRSPSSRASVSYATIFTVPSASYMRPAPHHSGYLGIINFQAVAPCTQRLHTARLAAWLGCLPLPRLLLLATVPSITGSQ
ncbi:hypothetical protein JOQ06_015517, partial [Pogonophryne albipinna]